MYTIRALKIGEQLVPGPEVYYQDRFGEYLMEYFYIWLVQGAGRTLLIDTGFPADVDSWNASTKAAKGEAAYWRLEAMPETVLAQAGVRPEQIDRVILSSLGGYASSNVALFPNAQFYVSRQGWLEYLAHGVPQLPRQRPGAPITWLVSEAFEQVHLIDGEATVAPGITAFETGCHHRSSLAIAVETRQGAAIVADCVFHYGNIEDGPVLGVLENLFECLDAYARIRREAAIVLPIHDPAVLERHPGGLIGGQV